MKQTSHWAHIEEQGIVWGMRFLLRVYLLFGRTFLQIFLYPVVVYYWLVNREARQASSNYLNRLASFSPALGLHGNLWHSYRHFISFANAMIDKLAAWSGAIKPSDVEYFGRDALLTLTQTGRGALLLGSHLGNLEVCRIMAHFDKVLRINVLVHTKHAEKFNRVLHKTSGESRLNLIQVTEITAATAQLLSDKIEAGELIIMTADRTPVTSQKRVSKVNFLGDEALFPQGPFILAGLLKCPVLTLFCLKKRDKFAIYFELFSHGLEFTRKTRDLMLQQEIQRYAQRLQDYCLKAPLQWFNFYDFWHI